MSNSSRGANELWLIRHGETEWSLSGAHTSHTDLPLTENGRRRAAAIGQYLAGRPFALVLSSPLQRAVDTCRLAGYGAACQIDPNLCEWNYGDYEGRTTADIQKENPGWSIWTGTPLHGETIEQVAARADAVLQRAESADGPVLLFAHGHFLRVLTACWLELTPDNGRLFALGTGTISILGYERTTQVITRWNLSVSE
jgi:probable phosphoglycerate mutase